MKNGLDWISKTPAKYRLEEIMRYSKEKTMKLTKRAGGILAGVLFAMILTLLLPASWVLAEAEGTVTASSANIRATADTSGTPLASVLKGDKLSITEEVTGTDGQLWYKVFVDSSTQGYIRADLVSKDGGSTIVPSDTGNSISGNTGAGTGSSADDDVTVNLEGVEAVQPISASVTKDGVRVRADSSTSSAMIETIKKDVVLTVHGTKAGSGSDIWYHISCNVNGKEIIGFIRSDFVTLSGELQPVVDEPIDDPQEPDSDQNPVDPPTETKNFETYEKDGIWYLVDNAAGASYPITQLITSAEENADALIKSQKKVSQQTGFIVVLAILVIVAALGITLLIFKIKDMTDEDGFDMSPGRRPARPSGGTGRQPVARPGGTRPAASTAGTRPAGSRPAGSRSAGTRPMGSTGSRPAATRPAATRPVSGTPGTRPVGDNAVTRPVGTAGTRPAGTRPVSGTPGTRPAGTRPAGENAGTRPAGTRPVSGTPGTRPAGTRPAGTRPAGENAGTRLAGTRPAGARPTESSMGEERLERQARANVETRNLEKQSAESQAWKSKNFISDDEEFEFEFLNWDGEE